MTKNQKNTVEVRVPRKRDGFKDHKTTVRKKVLPDLPSGAPRAGSGKPLEAGPEALGLTGASSMRVWLRPYRRKDGFVMVYANNDRGVSVGIAENGLPGYYAKTRFGSTSQGQRNLMDELKAHFARLEEEGGVIAGTPDFATHTEDKSRLGSFGDMYLTDVADVGGVKVGSDGAYLFREGKLYVLSKQVD